MEAKRGAWAVFPRLHRRRILCRVSKQATIFICKAHRLLEATPSKPAKERSATSLLHRLQIEGKAPFSKCYKKENVTLVKMPFLEGCNTCNTCETPEQVIDEAKRLFNAGEVAQ